MSLFPWNVNILKDPRLLTITVLNSGFSCGEVEVWIIEVSVGLGKMPYLGESTCCEESVCCESPPDWCGTSLGVQKAPMPSIFCKASKKGRLSRKEFELLPRVKVSLIKATSCSRLWRYHSEMKMRQAVTAIQQFSTYSFRPCGKSSDPRYPSNLVNVPEMQPKTNVPGRTGIGVRDSQHQRSSQLYHNFLRSILSSLVTCIVLFAQREGCSPIWISVFLPLPNWL